MWGWSLGEAWADFLSGKSVLVFSWGDVGSLAEDPTQSKIAGKLGARGIPGTKQPYDLEKKQFLNLSKPNMVGNQVGCSWHPVLSKFAKNPDLAFQNYIRIPGTPEMMEVWDVHLSEAVTGQVSPKEALDRTYQDWQKIIDNIGRAKLLKLYQQSIGYTK